MKKENNHKMLVVIQLNENINAKQGRAVPFKILLQSFGQHDTKGYTCIDRIWCSILLFFSFLFFFLDNTMRESGI